MNIFLGTGFSFSWHHRCVTHLYGSNAIGQLTVGGGQLRYQRSEISCRLQVAGTGKHYKSITKDQR